ncbi:RNA recognition motif 2-domain-containing protein [Zopfochytrium polystomum]|nr:RNA recognition motif 2-domain-containing protein [Zopfochytrium polystomum]KAI9357935.1 RNA recognition motif 2-domain-containing protein [Zopfochytrium polystomum]
MALPSHQDLKEQSPNTQSRPMATRREGEGREYSPLKIDTKDLQRSGFAPGRSAFVKSRHVTEAILSAPLPSPNFIPKENEFNLLEIVAGRERRTSIMLKNVPNRYTQDMLIDFLNETHEGLFDFVYLRMDFLNRCNVGYAFINFVNPPSIVAFAARVIGQKWPKFNSDKLPILCFANIQGKQAFVEKFRNSNVMTEEPSFRPRLFKTPNLEHDPNSTNPLRPAVEEAFPPPTRGPLRPKSNILFSRDKFRPFCSINGVECFSVTSCVPDGKISVNDFLRETRM